jgi:hypothetical protein
MIRKSKLIFWTLLFEGISLVCYGEAIIHYANDTTYQPFVAIGLVTTGSFIVSLMKVFE